MARRRFPVTAFWIVVSIAYAVFSVLAKDPPRDWSGHTVADNAAWMVGFCLPSEAIVAALLVLAWRRRSS